MDKIPNIALFIDGDNVCKSSFQENFNEIKLKGRICIKRIYFDFNNKLDDKWRTIILNNGIESISVLNLPSKNSTDIRLMLDMLKEFYNNPIIDIYIIMSSDSDFYHIATFLRSSGKIVICYGEKHTPLLLKNVCDEFVLCKRKDDEIINILNNINDEEKLYQDMININNFYININDIKNIKWQKYNYYKEYKNKIYILRDIIDKIKFINQNKNLENKNLSYLKDLLLQYDPSFSEKNFEFYSFKEFIQSLLKNEVQTKYDVEKKIEVITKINI